MPDVQASMPVSAEVQVLQVGGIWMAEGWPEIQGSVGLLGKLSVSAGR